MTRQAQPSPLAFHLGAAAIAYQQAILSAPNALRDDFPWHQSLRGQLTEIPDTLALAAEAARRMRQMLNGISAWQNHPHRRRPNDPETIWSQGSTRLLDYSTTPSGPPVLVIPSLINRAYILDLSPERSFLRHLAATGLRPYLLDWGAPTFDERAFDFDAYATDRLLPTLAIIRALTKSDVSVIGYCMGGTLATGLAARRPQGIANLVTLGAPWSFHGTRGIAGSIRTLLRTDPTLKLEALLDMATAAFGLIPADLFQILFAILNPIQAAQKFRRFAAMDPNSTEAIHFTQLEDWIADSVPMAPPAAKNLLIDWQIHDQPNAGNWRFLGGFVDPRQVQNPSLHITGLTDHIAPTASTAPLGQLIPQATTLAVHSGHVGMVVGHRAATDVWTPISDFLLQNRARS
jgi:polyhydroxyalkanoate synthase subunit PhaC